jgi:CubicO group peptidase (beta-lactamase class C family)
MLPQEPLSQYWRSSFYYNNWMLALAGHIAELLSGTTWENLVQQYYFTPLGMTGATFAHADHQWQNFAKYSTMVNGKWQANFDMDLTK